MEQDPFSDNANQIFTKFLSKIMFGLEKIEIDGYKIGPSIILLNYIGSHPDRTMSEISQFLNVPASTATRRIEKLDQFGFIERRIGKKDRRSVKLCLSDKGMRIYNKFIMNRMKGLLALKTELSPQEFGSFFKIIKMFNELENTFGI
ncbi:MarR family winged helix-turn-helix transcriptional regulator [Candidatus Lokiarchaeum ossiferum]|uniref:MarR family winged helix-turn-helix transcriptional regulator n=1 Tax=Candidatus Lokiarchaeum ossiferum TaxID=2951803 RepID=UPI00352CECC6